MRLSTRDFARCIYVGEYFDNLEINMETLWIRSNLHSSRSVSIEEMETPKLLGSLPSVN